MVRTVGRERGSEVVVKTEGGLWRRRTRVERGEVGGRRRRRRRRRERECIRGWFREGLWFKARYGEEVTDPDRAFTATCGGINHEMLGKRRKNYAVVPPQKENVTPLKQQITFLLSSLSFRNTWVPTI